MKNLIFDLDGTLVDSRQSILESIQILVKQNLNKKISLDEINEIYEADLLKMAKKLGFIKDETVSPLKLLEEWGKIVSHDYERIKCFEGIPSLLQSLVDSKLYNLYVWTARDRESTLAILRGQGIIGHFKDIRCADDTRQKPHPAGIIELVGEDAGDKTLVIGDSSADFFGADAIGADFILAAWDERVIQQGPWKKVCTTIDKLKSELL